MVRSGLQVDCPALGMVTIGPSCILSSTKWSAVESGMRYDDGLFFIDQFQSTSTHALLHTAGEVA